MVISHRHRYLYFVTPKCASATVRTSLCDLTDLGYPVTKGLPQHQTIAQFLAGPHASLFDAGYFRFTFVRNPYDRLYSGYAQDRVVAGRNPKWQKVKEHIFREIGDDFNRYVSEHVRYARRLDDWEWICFWPMHAFAFVDGECMLDWIGRAESVESDLTILSSRLGVEIVKAEDRNVHTPPSADPKYIDRYDRATIEIVNDLYREDFQRFGYERLDPALLPVFGPARSEPAPVPAGASTGMNVGKLATG